MIKELRYYHGFTQEMLATLLEVDVDTVRKWEYGLRNPSPKNTELLKEYKLWIAE